MKKVLMLAALVLGTTTMVNAQTAPAKTETPKEVKHAKHAKKQAEKKAEKAEKEAVKVEGAKAKK